MSGISPSERARTCTSRSVSEIMLRAYNSGQLGRKIAKCASPSERALTAPPNLLVKRAVLVCDHSPPDCCVATARVPPHTRSFTQRAAATHSLAGARSPLSAEITRVALAVLTFSARFLRQPLIPGGRSRRNSRRASVCQLARKLFKTLAGVLPARLAAASPRKAGKSESLMCQFDAFAAQICEFITRQSLTFQL